MSIPLQIALYTIVLPALVSGLTLVLGWWLKARRSTDSLGGTALALGLGYMAGHVGILGPPTGLPVEATQWLIYIALVGLVLGTAERKWGSRRRLTWCIRSVLLAIMGWVLLQPLVAYSWSALQSFGWVMGLTLASLALWATFERLNADGPPRQLGLLFILLGTAESVAIIASQSAVLAQLQGVLTSAMGAAFVLTWVFPRASVSFRTGTPVIVMLFIAHAICGFFYAELPAWSVACLSLAPILALYFWRRNGTMAKVAGFGGAIAAAIAAVFIAIFQSPPS